MQSARLPLRGGDMKRPETYQQPATYEEIVQCAASVHNRRLKELESAEKHIREIQDDLASLAKAGMSYGVGAGSMFLVDVSHELSGSSDAPQKRALHIDGGRIDECKDRLAKGFIALGWRVAHTSAQISSAILILQKPKTQARLHLYVSRRYVESLGTTSPREDA